MQHEVLIESLVYTGAGLGHLPDGKVVFVPGALPDERVTIELTAEKQNYAQARLLNIVDKTSLRLPAACEHAISCGGCPWQILTYPAQLTWKRRFVVDALSRIGKISDAENLVGEVHPSPHTWHYRNKVELAIFSTGKTQLQLGMHPPGNSQPIPINRCLLLPQDLSALPETLRGALSYALAREPIQPYRAAIRHSQRTNQTELALWSLPSAMRRAFVAKLLAQAAPFDSIVRVLTGSDGAERDVRRTEVLHGRGHWTESLARERFTVSAPSFFQVNTEVAEAMVAAVLSLAGAEGHALARLHIWDLYSGVGSFTLPLAAAGATVSAVEWEGSSIRDLRRNLDLAGLTDSVDVLPGDVARVITELADQGNLEPPDLIIVDPPAAGMTQDVITALAQTKATRLIYVSCDPQTLARDTARLQAQAFKFNHAQLFDLFPQTYHVETIALFQR